MTPYRGAPEPPTRRRAQLWLLPEGRLPVLVSALLTLFAAFMTVSLLRVDSPVALVGLVLLLLGARMLDGSFGRLVLEGDELSHRRGLSGRRTRSLSIASGCTVRVVTAAGQAEAWERRTRPLTRHLVEVGTPDSSWVVAEATRRAAAEAIADWLRENLPPDRRSRADA